MNNIINLRNIELSLFTEEEMNPRENANREEVLRVFSTLATDIVTKILEAGDCYLAYAGEHPIARQESTFPSSNIHGLIIEKLSEIKGVRITKLSKRNSIIEIGSYKVWVKKLDEDGLPWVNETKSSLKRVNQKADGDDVMPVLILGYQLDQIERITNIQLIYIEGDRHLWTPIDLGDMAVLNHLETISSPAPEEPIVTVKPDKQKSRESAI